MVPHHILSKMVEENGLNFKSRHSDELIDKLMDLDWTVDKFDNLKERLAQIERERTPKNRYVSLIDSVRASLDESSGIDHVQQVLRRHSASFGENGELEEEGFQLLNVEDGVIEGIHWSESLNYSLSPTREIETDRTLYETGIKLDLNNDIIFINSTMPMKARSVLNKLEDLVFEVSEVGHQTLTNKQANQMVQNFVDEVNEKLLERQSQATLGDGQGKEVLEVDLVDLLLDEDNIKNVKISGYTDIIGDKEVIRFKSEYDAKIHRLEGNFELGNNWFKFTAGFAEGMGQVNVSKKGRVEEKPELLDSAFDFLYNYYEEYFIYV